MRLWARLALMLATVAVLSVAVVGGLSSSIAGTQAVADSQDRLRREELERLKSLAAQREVHLVWSNVHVHLAARKVDKGEGLLEVLQRDGRDPNEVVTIGDAPNDAGLFVADRFGLTVGTADVVEHREALFALPQYVSQKREADAFLELTDRVLAHIVGA